MAGEIDIGLRWIHFVAGITWIGLLYFFNFVNFQAQKEIPGDVKPKVNPALIGRALFWFRHSAWVTVVVGLVMIERLYTGPGNPLFATDGGRTILVGGILGIIMLANVWGIIWPNQKKALHAMATGAKPDPKWAKNALYASRTNVTLSFPMLFFMAAATHYPLAWVEIGAFFVALAALGFGMIWFTQLRGAKAAAPAKPAVPAK